MTYLFARYTKRLVLVPIGVLFIINPVYSGESGSASDGLCNYCAEHNSGALRVGEISTAYVPMRGFAEEPEDDPFMELIKSPEGVQFCRYFASIKDPDVKRRVLDLVKSIAEAENAERN